MLSVAVSATLMIYAIIKHTAEKSIFLILLSIATLFYTFGNLLEITATSLDAAFYGTRVQYLGAPFILPITYLFYRDFCGKKRFTPMKLALFFVIPVLSMLSLQAFPMVRFHYGDIWYSTNGHIASIQHSDGITYYLGTANNYTCILLSLSLILRRIRNGGKLQRRQSFILLAGWLLPLVSNVSFIFLGGDSSYDLTPVTYVASMVMLLYAVLMRNLLNVLPLARAQVIDALEDAFIVCDDKLNFLDANWSARRLFPILDSLMPGESMDRVESFKSEGEVCILVNGGIRHFKAIATEIRHGAKNSGVCVVFRDVSEENRLIESLLRQARLDSLTGIYNRGAFFDLVGGTLELFKSKNLAFALLMIDVDYFKQVNDTYGHPCGDAVLKGIADIVKHHFRRGDIVGRYGGEEISVLLVDISEAGVVATAEKLRKTVEETTIPFQEQSIRVTISIGVTHSPAGNTQTLENLLAQADTALYVAKGSGRNCISLYKGK